LKPAHKKELSSFHNNRRIYPLVCMRRRRKVIFVKHYAIMQRGIDSDQQLPRQRHMLTPSGAATIHSIAWPPERRFVACPELP
jgi:hypothetical protein